MTVAARQPTFLPTVTTGDPLAAYWLRQVTLRLRREVGWLWRERGVVPAPEGESLGGVLPPYADRLESALDLTRHAVEKRRYLAEDTTAAHLSRMIAEPAPGDRGVAERGTFSWVARHLKLSEVECFVLALALSPVVDSAAGPVYAACLNDPARSVPTLGLAQRLWDRPGDLLAMANPTHPLYAHGLVNPPGYGGTGLWDGPVQVPALVADALLRSAPSETGMPRVFEAISPDAEGRPEEAEVVVARLRSAGTGGLRLVPLIGVSGTPLAGLAAGLGRDAGLRVVGLPSGPMNGAHEAWLGTVFTLAWQHGLALYAPIDNLLPVGGGDGHGTMSTAAGLPLPCLPVTVFVGLAERSGLRRLPSALTLPALTIPLSTYEQRRTWWRDHLPGMNGNVELDAAVSECARRFRYSKGTILGICRDLGSLGRPVKPADLVNACRADVDLGDLAQAVPPRFSEADLMLPAKQAGQVKEIVRAMRMLTRVHYEWGTHRAWNESGLTALFAGPPGTGKTMAAEVIARELELPLYRIDLSQVVNKYIGETEKNLRRLFDAAEASDVILFFDEADSLFGKRTEVKDAHDRYANLEVSYLLERMERFKGLAILATNRKKDLDEAFLRRLRFLIDFPLPGLEERLRIWRRLMPEGVDVSGIDFDFLARRFPLAGGHIRSVVFQACLQSAQPGGPRKLTMDALVAAVKRENDKLDRAVSLEQYGVYAPIAQRLF